MGFENIRLAGRLLQQVNSLGLQRLVPHVKRRVVLNDPKARTELNELPDEVRLIEVVGERVNGDPRVFDAFGQKVEDQLASVVAEPVVLLRVATGVEIHRLGYWP